MHVLCTNLYTEYTSMCNVEIAEVVSGGEDDPVRYLEVLKDGMLLDVIMLQ